MSNTRRFINEKEFEVIYNIKRTTLRRWRSERKGPPFHKIAGRAVRYEVAAVDAWIAKCPVGGEVD